MARPVGLRILSWTGVAGALLSTSAPSQLCPIPCPASGGQIVCHHQNGIRNCRGGSLVPLLGPNAFTGNVAGDAFWKIWGVENGMTRGSGVATFTNWEIGADVPANICLWPGGGGPLTFTFDIPDLELRIVNPAGTTTPVREPDLAAPPLYSATAATIVLPTGGFRINVSILLPATGTPASCPATATLPTLPNADVAMLFLLTPGETPGCTYYRNFATTAEINSISNPPVPPAGTGNSYSGTFDAATGTVTHFLISQELFAEMGFFEPTLEASRQTPGFTASGTGSGARELAPGDTFFLRSEDWEAGTRAIAGQDRLAAVVISDNSLGSPLGLAPPGPPPGFLAGSLFLPGSAGVLGLFPTASTTAFLAFSTTIGAGVNCHVLGDVTSCATTTPSGPNAPSVFADMRATTATIAIPPGLSGAVLYAAAFYINLSTLTLDDGSNTVELLFL